MPFPVNRSVVFVGYMSLLAAATPAVAQQTRLRSEWTDYALQYRDQPGRRITVVCPAEGKPGKLFGTDTYTDDSSVCTAAAHAGVISAEKGGVATIVIGKGASSFEASTRNGIESGKFGAYAGSFTFDPDNLPGQVDWSTTGVGIDVVSEPLTLICPPEGDARRVWGTGTYTEDSSICTAAVHAGRISFKAGGTVTVEPTGPQEVFSPSERFGVTTLSWKTWPVSFSVTARSLEAEPVKPAPSQPAPKPLPASYSISAPAFAVTGTFIPLVASQSLSTPQLSVTGIFIPLVTAHAITTPTLAIQGQ
jgi:hypothetical protein